MSVTLDKIIEQFADDFLICDVHNPIICNTVVNEEAALYNLSEESINECLTVYKNITGETLTLNTELSTLSGGQKVALMLLLALYSPAQKIVIIDFKFTLDAAKTEEFTRLIQSFRHKGKEIKLMDTI